MLYYKSKDICSLLVLISAILTLNIVGCTPSAVHSKHAVAPGQDYKLIAVGKFDLKDDLWFHLVPHFKRGLINTLDENKSFDSILDPAPETIPNSAIILKGRISEIDKGNAALRFMIGMGAGAATIKGSFIIQDARGKNLAEFDAKEQYAGGIGIGGAGFIDMEDLMQEFGETIAERTIRWSKGLPLEIETPKTEHR